MTHRPRLMAPSRARRRLVWPNLVLAFAGVLLPSMAVAGAPGGNPRELTNVNGTLFFAANDGVDGFELWKSNGSPGGTVQVKDVYPDAPHSQPRELTAVGLTLYFIASTDDGPNLWKSDGSGPGTTMVELINNGNALFSDLSRFGTKLVFFADTTDKGRELWISNGTPAGTKLVRDIAAGPIGGAQDGSLVVVGPTAYFFAYDSIGGIELWKSDGTASGTVRVKDITPGAASSTLSHPVKAGGTLYFMRQNGAIHSLWKSNGTASGTFKVKDLPSEPDEVTAVGSRVFFVAQGGAGPELWVSNGTANGTKRVKDIVPGPEGSSPAELTKVGTTLFFSALSPDGDRELWKSNGKAGGTRQVKEINPADGDAGRSLPESLTAIGGTLRFSADDGSHGREPWRSDGTGPKTTLIKDVNTNGADGSSPREFTKAGSVTFFVANDGVSDMELWKITSSGAALVKDINEP